MKNVMNKVHEYDKDILDDMGNAYIQIYIYKGHAYNVLDSFYLNEEHFDEYSDFILEELYHRLFYSPFGFDTRYTYLLEIDDLEFIENSHDIEGMDNSHFILTFSYKQEELGEEELTIRNELINNIIDDDNWLELMH